MIKLDYSLQSPEERKQLVEKIISDNPNLTPGYLEILADYLIFCMDKQEKKQKEILTDNRMVTVGKRETSFEGLSASLEGGEDSVYGLITEDKNMIFQPKITITKKDIETIPFLKQMREGIDLLEQKLKHSSGKDAYILKKALIEMRKEQYIIKQAYLQPVATNGFSKNPAPNIKLEDFSTVAENGDLTVRGVSLMNPKVVSAILRDYSNLKQSCYGVFDGDTFYLMEAFDDISERALADHPLYLRLLEYKIDGLTNLAIQDALEEEFGIRHSLEYISSLWRNKIPKLIAGLAREEYLTWHYRTYGLPMKTCTRCGQEKPAHNDFFSKNNTSKDHFYSICKKCRNKKRS